MKTINTMELSEQKQNENRQMTPEEIFEYYLEYFEENKELFTVSEIIFLQSVIDWSLTRQLTWKQRSAFNSTVSRIEGRERRFLERCRKVINRIR